MPTDPVLDALKAQTRPLHDRLEACVDLPQRLQSLEAYQQLLAAFYGFYLPVETRLAECAELQRAGLDIEPRRKVALLVQDLQQWDVDVDSLPRTTDLPAVASAPEAFGCLYVLEGATLGSQIIKRLLVQQLAISAENGGAFFNAYGERVGLMWDAFRQSLSQYAATHPQERDAIVSAAQDTFRKLEAWFARCFDASNPIGQAGDDRQ